MFSNLFSYKVWNFSLKTIHNFHSHFQFVMKKEKEVHRILMSFMEIWVLLELRHTSELE